jgi:hypothetical protein
MDALLTKKTMLLTNDQVRQGHTKGTPLHGSGRAVGIVIGVPLALSWTGRDPTNQTTQKKSLKI